MSSPWDAFPSGHALAQKQETSVSQWEVHAAKKLSESRLGAQWIQIRSHLQPHHAPIVVRVSLLEQTQGWLILVQGNVDGSERKRRGVSVLRTFPQLVQDCLQSGIRKRESEQACRGGQAVARVNSPYPLHVTTVFNPNQVKIGRRGKPPRGVRLRAANIHRAAKRISLTVNGLQSKR